MIGKIKVNSAVIFAAGFFVIVGTRYAHADLQVERILTDSLGTGENVRDLNLTGPSFLRNDFENRSSVAQVEWSFTDVTVPNRPISIGVKHIVEASATHQNGLRSFINMGTVVITQSERGVVFSRERIRRGLTNGNNFLGAYEEQSNSRTYHISFGLNLPAINGLPSRFFLFTSILPRPKAGDVNEDGVVNLSDLNIVRNKMGTDSQNGDANFDGRVDTADLNIVRNQFGAK